jgi:hypothetical protein
MKIGQGLSPTMEKPTRHMTNKLNCKHLHDVAQIQFEGTFG